MIFWDEVLIPAGAATLAGVTLAVISVSASARAGMWHRMAVKWAEAAPVLLLLTLAPALQAYVHLDSTTGAARFAHRLEQVVVVALVPLVILIPVVGIRRVRSRD